MNANTPNEIATQEVKVYGLTAKFFHWGFLVVFVYGLIKQIDDICWVGYASRRVL